MCEPSSAPVLCLRAAPEGPHALVVGERVVLPGECIQGPADEGGGRLRLVLRTSGTEVGRSWVRVRPGMRTDVRVDADRVEVVEHHPCQGQVLPEPR